MRIPIVDMHCDLLGCMADSGGEIGPMDPRTRCSLPQLRAGGVLLQTFAVAVIEAKGGVKLAKTQVELYQSLLKSHPGQIVTSKEFQQNSDKIHGLLSIENALALVEEDEPLEKAFERFEKMSRIESILYVSLTWNHENRFGGGNVSSVGLKRDGELLLEFLSTKKVAVDLSHTSDALAYDILNTIYKKNLPLKVMASHSNCRKVMNVPRNLPDEIIKEIVTMGGVIGMNFIRRFVGDRKEDFLDHVEHFLGLRGEDSLSLGADFYGGMNIPPHLIPGVSFPVFQKELEDASCYLYFVSLLEKRFNRNLIEKICSQNALSFIRNLGLI